MTSGSVRRGRQQVSLALLLALVGFVVLSPLGTTTSWALSDIPSSFWAAAWIGWLVDMGIVKGYPDGAYHPSDVVTRDQMAVFIGRALQDARLNRGLGFVEPTDVAGKVRVGAAADLNAAPDLSQLDPGVAAGYRLYASTDGVSFTPATNATYDGTDCGLVAWNVAGVTVNTYFRPVAILSTSPLVERPLCGILMARPSETPASIAISQPPSLSAPRLPRITWTGVPGAVWYLVLVAPTSPPDSPLVYAAAVEGWRTSLLFGCPAGPGIILGVPKVEALSGGTQYNLGLYAIDATGWRIGGTRQSFTTGTALLNPFAGTYSAYYTTGSSGSITIAVAADGAASIVITDSSVGVLTGTGTVSDTGGLTATAQQQGDSLSVGLSGQFANQGGTIACSGSMTGSISVAWTAQKIADVGVNAFAGNWSGTYWGTEGGTWQAVIQTDGSVSATAQSPSVGTFALTGTVAPAGSAALQGSGSGVGGPFTITWEGTFYMQAGNAVGSGTWLSTSGYNGNWAGQRQ